MKSLELQAKDSSIPKMMEECGIQDVDTNYTMGNKFILKPTEDVIVEVDKMFSISDGIISIGVEELRAVINDAENILFLTGKGTGTNRVSDAIEDAVLHTCTTAPGYNLFTSNKVIVQLTYSDKNELMMEEIGGMTQFAEMFSSQTEFLWGISKSSSMTSSFIKANIIAANIKQK